MMVGVRDLPAAAEAAQTIAEAQARAIEGDTLPEPPAGLPALRSIEGTGINGASVLGYVIKSAMVLDCYGPDGKMRVPGDAGFLEAQYGRLGLQPMPPGWRFVKREAQMLYALVKGNPVLLEDHARRLGYSRALATAPNVLRLSELD